MIDNKVDAKGYRGLHPGMGQAVAERTILRKKQNGVGERWETWGEVADRVALGNSLLCPDKGEQQKEYQELKKHIANASILMSGRHLQHGDEDQPNRNQEVFCNCASAASGFSLFYLLLNGTGVGRCYDDDMMLVNWDHAPNLRCVIDHEHKDFNWSAHESVRDAKHKYKGKDVFWFEVPDSREGWAQALEVWEIAAFEKVHKDKLLILDFTKVRPAGSPIKGMQNRPSSGPVSLMNAFNKASTLKGSGLERWRQALYIDHYFAECVLVGGARRAARMSTKWWKDESIIDFIRVKRPVEYEGLNMDEIIELREGLSSTHHTGFLWSSNNSVAVDGEFWRLLKIKRGERGFDIDSAKHARKVFQALTQAAYADGTGEPGIINVDKLVQKDEGWDALTGGDYIGSKKYKIREETELYLSRLAKKAQRKKYTMITNPCGEIALTILGGYCVIADVVPFHTESLDEAEGAFRLAARALIRVNLMNSLYDKEVKRTNRIGVAITGVHEFAWKFFGFTFNDLIDEEKSKEFWMTLARFNRAVHDESVQYSKALGVKTPHTMTTVKPSGTISKLFGLTEGWHLPAMRRYMRWVQFRGDDPLVETYRTFGYPVRELKQYEGTKIVGFPTQPTISEIMPDDKIVTAGEAAPEDQYKWLMLGEKYWINGVNRDGTETKWQYGNQISFTMKYLPEKVDFKHFRDMLLKYQSQIRCCSVMPQTDSSAYEYQPEESLTKAKYEEMASAIQRTIEEDVGKEHLGCDAGACPINYRDDDSDEAVAWA